MRNRNQIMSVVALAAALSWGCGGSTSVFRRGNVSVYTFENGYNNAHLVVQDGNAVLIDAGLRDDAAALDAQIRAAGVDPASLQALILSHGHADHAGGARHFQEKYNVPIVAGSGDRLMLAAGRNDRLCPTDGTARCLLHDSQTPRYSATAADVWISAPTSLDEVSKLQGQITPLRGHTPGSLVVSVADFAIVGDLFRGGIVGSAAATHFYMCDLEDNRRDISLLLATIAPRATTFFVGHFGPVSRSSVEPLALAH